MATKIKKISELEQMTTLSDSSNVVIEENGKAKRIAASNFAVEVPVTSVNGQTGDVVIDIPEVEIPEINYPVTSVNGMTGDVVIEAGSEQVQSDWNQNDPTQPDFVKNRTHWEENNQTVIRADGITEGMDAVYLEGQPMLYRISDAMPTWDDLLGATVEATFGDESERVEITEEMLAAGKEDSTATVMLVTDPFPLYIALVDNAVLAELTFPKKGTYALGEMLAEAAFTLTYGSTTVHKLDPKFLPEGGFGWEEGSGATIEWDGNTEGLPNIYGELYKVSDLTPAPEDLIGGTFEGSNGETVELTSDMMEGANGISFIANIAVVNMTPQQREEEGLPDTVTNGIYFYADDSYHVTKLTYVNLTVHKIDKKFLPNNAGALIVKITPNDEGSPVASYTRDQIADAINDGKTVACYVENGNDNGNWIWGTSECKVTEAAAEFCVRYVDANTDFSPAQVYMREETFIIDNEGNAAYTNRVADLIPASSSDDKGKFLRISPQDGFLLEWCPPADAVADAAGETPTAAEFNALLAALRAAGYLATE